MEGNEFQVVIVSPEQTLFEGTTNSVVLPGEMGKFEVLKNHAPIISPLVAGEIRYKQGTESHSLTIQGGFVEMKDNQLSVCVEL